MKRKMRTKMRILIAADLPVYVPSGGISFMKRLAAALMKDGHEVLLVCPSHTLHDEKYTLEGIKILGIHSFPSLFTRMRICLLIGMKSSAEKALKEFRPDIVHLQNHFAIGAAFLKAARKSGIPVIGTNHFMPENLTPYIPKILVPSCKWMLWKHMHSVYKNVDHVTTPTKTAAFILASSGFSKQVQVISNGIDLKTFYPRNTKHIIEKKFSLQRKPMLLFVGRLDTEKNLDTVLRAFSFVLKETDAHFIIVGRGARENSLKNLVKKLGIEKNVTFTGFVSDEDLPKLYCAADCFVMAGTAELQSIATMEAMASGLPIVAVNAAALPELVHHGENGYLFPVGDSKVLSREIVKILAHPGLRKKMSQKSLQYIKTHDMRSLIQKYEHLYLAVIAQHKNAV